MSGRSYCMFERFFEKICPIVVALPAGRGSVCGGNALCNTEVDGCGAWMVAAGTVGCGAYWGGCVRRERRTDFSGEQRTVEAAARRRPGHASGFCTRSQAGLGMVRLASRRARGGETASGA